MGSLEVEQYRTILYDVVCLICGWEHTFYLSHPTREYSEKELAAMFPMQCECYNKEEAHGTCKT